MPKDRATAPPNAPDRSQQRPPPAPRGRRALAFAGRLVTSRAVKYGFVVVAVGLACYAVAADWTSIRAAMANLGLWAVLGALAAVLVAYLVSVQAWRLLMASLGSPLPFTAAAKIVLIGQLGKYMPGKVSSLVASMELSRAYQIPRARSASALVLQVLLSMVTGLVAAAVTLPFVAGSIPDWWAILAVPVLLALLHPRVLNAIIGLLLRVARQDPLQKPLTIMELLRPMGWLMVGWAFYGLQIWVLAVRLGARPGPALLVAIGGFAFAWAAGFLAVFVPAGAGVRDVLLLVLLLPVLARPDATAVVLASRVATTAADLISAGVSARFVRRPPAASETKPASRSAGRGSRHQGPAGCRPGPQEQTTNPGSGGSCLPVLHTARRVRFRARRTGLNSATSAC